MKKWITTILLFLNSFVLYASTLTVTNGNDTGSGSLREAITNAAPGDIILFSGVSTVSLTSAELNLNKSLTIDGGVTKVTITRTGSTVFRIFNINGTNTNQVLLQNLKITNGKNNSQAGGIQNSVTLTMTNCEVSGNESNQSGGIQNDYIMAMTNCLVINNIYDGGLATNGVSFTATNCVFAGNEGFGLKAVTPSTVITLNNCLINNNIATPSSASRPGIGLNFGAASGSTLKNCTITSNVDNGIRYGTSASNINIVNCIVSNNGASNISGTGNLSAASTNNYVGTTASGGLSNGVNGNIIGGTLFLTNIADPDGADNTYITSDDGLRITSASPAYNSGTNLGVTGTDILGNVRPYNSGIADMGAYEYSQAVPPPTITFHPPTTVFCADQGGSFFIGTLDATIFQWQVKPPSGFFTNLSNTGVYSGVTTNTLVLSSVIGLENYEYRCIINNSTNNSVTSNAAVLTLKYKTTIAYNTYSTGYPVGSPISDIVPTLGGGSTLGFAISPNLTAGLTINSSTGIISGTPTLNSSLTTYTITVQNECGPSTASVQFSTSTVAPPTISSHPINVNTCGNGSASFNITSTGTRQWQVNNGSGWTNISNTGPYSGNTSATLNITNVSGLDGFKYRCFVSTASGSLISNEATLSITTLLTVTNGNNSGTGSLRDFIGCAVPGDTIIFDAAISSITLTGSNLLIDKKITIIGGATRTTITKISTSIFRIFDISLSADVKLENLIIENGRATQGGGINNAGILTMNNCIVRNNRANQANAIENDNILTMNNCQILDNNGTSSGRGIVIYGSSTTANNCIFSGTGGDAIETAVPSAKINISNCLFVNNNGSGINFTGAAGSTITNCTFSKNTAKGIDLNSSSANIILKNSVFAGNTSTDIASLVALGSTSTHNLVGSNNAGGMQDGVNNNIVNKPILFLNDLDGDGADNIWLTADDGFQLTTCSPAVDNGLLIPTLMVDITGNTKPFSGTSTDLGAYEFQGFGILKTTTSALSVSQNNICANTTISLAGNCAVGTATWYTMASGGSSFASGASINVTPAATITYYVSCKNATCEGARIATPQIFVLPSGSTVPTTLTLTANISANIAAQQAKEYINATNKIQTGVEAIYQSGKAINLNPGFETTGVKSFIAKTDYLGCP